MCCQWPCAQTPQAPLGEAAALRDCRRGGRARLTTAYNVAEASFLSMGRGDVPESLRTCTYASLLRRGERWFMCGHLNFRTASRDIRAHSEFGLIRSCAWYIALALHCLQDKLADRGDVARTSREDVFLGL